MAVVHVVDVAVAAAAAVALVVVVAAVPDADILALAAAAAVHARVLRCVSGSLRQFQPLVPLLSALVLQHALQLPFLLQSQVSYSLRHHDLVSLSVEN